MKNYFPVSFGCDPEFFFEEGGKIIGAEKVLGKLPGGELKVIDNGREYGKVIIDGVQGEMNPTPNNCRESHAYYIGTIFTQLKNHLPKGVSVNFDQMVDVTEDEMVSLNPKSQQFGCTPSMNVYGAQPVQIQDASKYLKRSAGGHVHLGYVYDSYRGLGLLAPEKIVPILDILVGNTCVLLDRSEGNKERRKNYGRAGEYRLPSYGIEYRTLSNFWLHNYTMMHFVFGLCRQAMNIVGNDMAEEFLKLVDQKDIIKAINENDFDLAMSNFKKIVPFLQKTPDNGSYPLNENSIIPFMFLVEEGYKNVFEGGIDPWVALVKREINGDYTGWDNRVGFESWAYNMNEKLKSEKKEYYDSIVKSLS